MTHPTTAPVRAAAEPSKAGSRNPFSQRGFKTLFSTEAKVWARDRANIFWALLFPSVMLAMNGLGAEGFATEAVDVPYGHHFYGLTILQIVLPMMIIMAAALPFVSMMPVTFGSFREKGVLKRFSGSPMRSETLILTHYLINLAGVLGGVAVVLGVTGVVWGIAMPVNFAFVALGFVLATLVMASIGTVVGARVAKGTVANAMGMIVFFALIIAGGGMGNMLMNETFMNFARFTPFGAAGMLMEAGWFGGAFPLAETLALVAWIAVFAPLGVKLFRWR
jgi:ABC-2 type transport system permease protein